MTTSTAGRAKLPVYKATARLTGAQQYALAVMHWEGSFPHCSIATLRRLEKLGLIDAAYRITQAGRQRVINDRLYLAMRRDHAALALAEGR